MVEKGRHLRRLQDHGIACGERRTELPAGHGYREIPRRDGADHAIGLGHDHAEVAVVGRHQVAAFLVCKFGEETDLFGGNRDIAFDQMPNGRVEETASSLARVGLPAL